MSGGPGVIQVIMGIVDSLDQITTLLPEEGDVSMDFLDSVLVEFLGIDIGQQQVGNIFCVLLFSTCALRSFQVLIFITHNINRSSI